MSEQAPHNVSMGRRGRARRERRLALVVGALVLALGAAGCGASRAFTRAENAARAGDWDAAVEYYRRAVQQSPDRTDYKIALERAMINASHAHLNQAQIAEARAEFEIALREYRRASEFDPPNRQLAAKVSEIERKIRDQAEAQPRNNIAQLREQIRVLEIDNHALRDSRDMFQNRNAELMKTVKSLQARLKKLEG